MSILECAGGSCRDSRYLAVNGVDATGSDFDQKTVDYLQQRFPNSPLKMLRLDAFSTNLEKNSFDVVFNNGFWVLFESDKKIAELLNEQIRVAKELAIVLVHNKKNKRLMDIFKKKSEQDSLYNIRFFDREDLEKICSLVGIASDSISFEKFGGPVDRIYGLAKIFPWLANVIYAITPKLYRFQPWSRVERIALIIKV